MSRAKGIIIDVLTVEEAAELRAHELIVSQGLGAFVAVGKALLAINEKRLYRAEHKTFEDYLEKRWDMSRGRGYQMMRAAELTAEMCTTGTHLENERQARALQIVPPHLRTVILQRIKDSGEALTEQTVTRAVVRLLDERKQQAREQPAADDEDEREEAAPVETPAASTLRRAAEKYEKKINLPSGLEHGRLMFQRLGKVTAKDLKSEEAREELRRFIDKAEELLAALRGWLDVAEGE